MPAITRAGRVRPAPAEPIRQSERLRRRRLAAATTAADTLAPRPSASGPRTHATHLPPAPPNPDHVHAAQARFQHLNSNFNAPHALAMVGRISTENARLTRRLPNLRHKMHDLMLQCLPFAHLELHALDFGQRRNDLSRLSHDMGNLHLQALEIEQRLQACVLRGEPAGLEPIDVEFQQLYAGVQWAIENSNVISASLERHLMLLRAGIKFRPPIIAAWHLLPAIEVRAQQMRGEHCPLSMAEVQDLAEPLVLPMGEGLQLYSRPELELWLYSSKQHTVDEYLFQNPTSNTWEKFSALRRLILVDEA